VKIVKTNELPQERIVKCPKNGFTSNRILTATDGMGYSLTKTIIPPGEPQVWHYKNHLESCYCLDGLAEIENMSTGEKFQIEPDVTYVLDSNERHRFTAKKETVLLCVFNPPLVGDEVHDETGSYPPSKLSPVYNVKGVPIDKVKANDYNPNSVAPPEMELLKTSIQEDGYTQPVVTVYDNENDEYIVIDGFHRFLTLKNNEDIRERENGLLPVVVLNKGMHDRMASTIRHNRARGSHNIDLMSSIVTELVEMGKSDRWICKHIGMSPDELLRMKQITGVAALFKDKDFSKSWDVEGE
jgi:quercetin dioxygenase-like cupin family protein